MSETQNQNAMPASSPDADAEVEAEASKLRRASVADLIAVAEARTRALLGRLERTRIEIRFDLRGKSAGQVRIRPDGRALIRYNLELLKRGGADFIEETIPHEVAHVLAYQCHGPGIRPHGAEWQRIMRMLGAEPTRCHDYDVSGLETRTLHYFDYHCGCMAHRLSSIRHNKVAKGQRYLCKRCGEPLKRGSRSAAS
ncbi:SprT-like domain-containing protein [Halochromatium salexigens]|uniref:SprT-like domain-containing protein n=1 Tax=Halochromatium salexigens TaxID=49447 RepID=UPI0019115F87